MTNFRNSSLSFLLFAFFIISFDTFSQSASGGHYRLMWKEPGKILDTLGQEKEVIHFSEAVHLPEFNYLPSCMLVFENLHVSEFVIENPQFTALTEKEQKLFSGMNSGISYSIDIKFRNKNPVSLVYIHPFRLNPSTGQPEKLTSFDYRVIKSTVPLTEGKGNAPRIVKRGNQLTARTNSVNNSVLSQGQWYKLSIPSSGIYKIDHAYLKNVLGIEPSSINPREIKIFGNGGGMLPQPNSTPRYDDLVENAIFIQGEEDNSFDAGDYILFYGQGPHTWTYNAGEEIFNHHLNFYSDASFYFLTIGPGHGERIQNQANAGSPSQTITEFDDYIFYEQELISILNSGREWYGETFDFTLERDFGFNIPGLVPNSVIRVTASTVSRSSGAASFRLRLNNQLLGTQSFTSSIFFDVSLYSYKGEQRRNVYSINASSIGNNPNLNVNIFYDKQGRSSARGYLNFLEINAKRTLSLYGTQTAFRSLQSTTSPFSEFRISNMNFSAKIWDITDPLTPKNQLFSLSGSQAAFVTVTDTLKEFIVFSGSNFGAPAYTGRIANQNLHSIDAPHLPDLIIITTENFLSAANRLAAFRKLHDNLDAEVITVNQIYNEFSSGTPDVTAIRDFMKMLYDRKTATDSVSYLLLFGDASYDFKNRIPNNTNFVPIYHSRQSLHPIFTYSSDDYYGFLDNNEGAWNENNAGNHLLDIGIGRIMVKSSAEAQVAVDKLINYSQNKACLGNWRNKICFVADDGDGNLHLNSANTLSNIINSNYPVYNTIKIFLDAYPQIPSPSGEVAPAVNEAINQNIEKGIFIINYTGHGSEFQWAQERILSIGEIQRWNNYNNLPFMVTATCEFGRFDDPAKVSGAEVALLSGSGGVIGLLASTRPVFSNSNDLINNRFYNHVFADVNGQKPRLGYVMIGTKNTSLYDVNNRNYALLGDPSMRLSYPQKEIIITKINGNEMSSEPDTLKALAKARLEGEVRDNGALLADFNGKIHITVFDKESIVQTFGNQSTPTSFKALNNFIYQGPATVKEGRFSVEFVVPKDISYLLDKGKISMYAEKTGTLTDAAGYSDHLIIGGTSPDFIPDNIPPVIRPFLNDESFVFGGVTHSNPVFLARLSDENGINIAGTGIGHEITLVVSNDNAVRILNDFYTADIDDYKNGSIRYPLRDLPPGNHSLRIKAWDTHNNSGEAYLEFIVISEEDLGLRHILNYPNPFSTHTTFHFDHNRAGDDLDVLVQIYTVSGKLIKTLNNRYFSSSSHIGDIAWDGRDDFGDKIGKGVYVYKVHVRSLRDGSHNFKYQKLVILN